MHEDLEDAMAIGTKGKEIFSIQLVLDKNHRVDLLTGGNTRRHFRPAVKVADRQFVLR